MRIFLKWASAVACIAIGWVVSLNFLFSEHVWSNPIYMSLPSEANPDISVVAVDDPRELSDDELAVILTSATRGGAKAVVLDKYYEKRLPSGRLLASLATCSQCILPLDVVLNEDGHTYSRAKLPVFFVEFTGVGYGNAVLEYGRVPVFPISLTEGVQVSSMAIQAVAKYFGVQPRYENDRVEITQDIQIPCYRTIIDETLAACDPKSLPQMPIYFAGRQNAFNYLTADEAMRAAPDSFRSKIVLVGYVNDENDLFDVPVLSEPTSKMPGIWVHANAVNTILSKKFVKAGGDLSGWLIFGVLVIGTVGGLVFSFLSQKVRFVSLLILYSGYCLGVIVVCTMLLRWMSIFVPYEALITLPPFVYVARLLISANKRDAGQRKT